MKWKTRRSIHHHRTRVVAAAGKSYTKILQLLTDCGAQVMTITMTRRLHSLTIGYSIAAARIWGI